MEGMERIRRDGGEGKIDGSVEDGRIVVLIFHLHQALSNFFSLFSPFFLWIYLGFLGFRCSVWAQIIHHHGWVWSCACYRGRLLDEHLSSVFLCFWNWLSSYLVCSWCWCNDHVKMVLISLKGKNNIHNKKQTKTKTIKQILIFCLSLNDSVDSLPFEPDPPISLPLFIVKSTLSLLFLLVYPLIAIYYLVPVYPLNTPALLCNTSCYFFYFIHFSMTLFLHTYSEGFPKRWCRQW